MAALTEEQPKTDAGNTPNPQRERQRNWYLRLTPELKEERRLRQAEQQRARRAKQKAGIYAGRNTVDPAASLEKRRKRQREWMSRKRAKLKAEKAAAAASRIDLQPVSEVPAPKTSAKPTKAPQAKPAQPLRSQDIESYEDLSTHKAKALQKAWRAEVSDYLLDCLTAPESPLTGAGLRASKMLAFWFNLSQKIDRIVEADSDKPDSQQEMTLALLIECLRRLTGEGKTAAAPTLPGIAGANRKATQ